MSGRIARLLAVVRADVLIRLRRPSTVVVFVLLSVIPYLWIPDPATGRALIQVGGSRALYNSAAVGMATAVLGTMFIGLIGFYVISNALRRDVVSRCGFVIASTTMRGSEYIAGKFAGNVAFLSIFTAGYMVVSMAMLLIRGEAPLEPLVFTRQYALLLPPAIVFVSAIAILFEATPILRSRLGDVLYFFLWLGLMGAVASITENGGGTRWPMYFDVSGLGFVMEQVRALYGTETLSIGMSDFEAGRPPVVFPGLQLTGEAVATRLGSLLWPLALLLPARLFFHRFDPARVRASGARSAGTWVGRLNRWSKPLSRLLVAPVRGVALRFGGGGTFGGAVLTDGVATLTSAPLAVVAMAGFAIASLTADDASAVTGVLPFAFVTAAVFLSAVSSREKREGTLALVYAAPRLRSRFVWWKFASALVTAAVLLAVPVVRAMTIRPELTMPLLVGLVFTVAAATAIGILSSNPKAFIVLFLMFWYISLSDKGASPELDFAGWSGAATPAVTAAYAAIALALLILAQLFHQRELRRNW